MPEDFSGDEAAKAERRSPVNRRRFVKSVGIAAGVAFTGSKAASARSAPPSNRTVGDPQPVSRDNLGRLVRSVTGEDDVVNLMGSDWTAKVRGSTAAELSHDDRTGRDERPQKQYKLEVDGEVTIVGAAKHKLDGGNEMTAIAFVNEGEAIFHYEYDDSVQGVKSKAKLWEITGTENIEETRLISTETSVNGEVTKSPADFSTTSGCPGCDRGPAGGGYREVEDCAEYDWMCLGSCCGTCAGASLCGPFGIYCGIACVATFCMACLAYCCEELETDCQYCPGMT